MAKSNAAPAKLYESGKIKIMFKREGGTNVVVSELWLWECDSEPEQTQPAAETTTPKQTSKVAPTKAMASLPTPADPDATQVLLVTGQDYPGHKWKLTAPVLAEELRKDERLTVTVVENPSLLGDPKLAAYDVVVLHFMDWETPPPDKDAQENFRRFVDAGGGLVVVHFACGAFQEWPGFVKVAGRAS